MIFMTFISIHYVIICHVLSWRTYETHPTLSLKTGCDTTSSIDLRIVHTKEYIRQMNKHTPLHE
jgi:hypothetical protein